LLSFVGKSSDRFSDCQPSEKRSSWRRNAINSQIGNVEDEMVVAVFPGVALAERASRNTARG
jgi:hypothetical protein